MALSYLHVDGAYFREPDGRAVMLRGVNLSGNAKLPMKPYMPTTVGGEPFFDDVNISFVGRPFSLSDADEHLLRLKRWGFNFHRLNITWEALEHSGPGVIDHDYIAYIVAVLQKCKEHGIRVFIDPHQDAWSRFTGGSGAPGWTLRAAGLNMRNFNATGAALVHNTHPDRSQYKTMIWPINYDKLACATMWTLFFAGKTFAPDASTVLNIEGENIQDYLQRHYCSAIQQLARAIWAAGDLADTVVVGYDTLNEPSAGYIGKSQIDIERRGLADGAHPTNFQGMMLGAGLATEVNVWESVAGAPSRIRGTRVIDPNGVSAWLEESGGCVWARHGVWDVKTRTLLKPDYFATDPKTGKPVGFAADYFRPFCRRFTAAIRMAHPMAIIIPELVPGGDHEHLGWDPAVDPVQRVVAAPHFYDGYSQSNRTYGLDHTLSLSGIGRRVYKTRKEATFTGEANIQKAFNEQFAWIKEDWTNHIGPTPIIIGETGIHFAIDHKRKIYDGDQAEFTRSIDFHFKAIEENLLNVTWWVYVPDHLGRQDGDGWNDEDFSIYSPGTPTVPGPYTWSKLDVGGRCLPALVRPYPTRTPGTPLEIKFDYKKQIFRFRFVREAGATSPPHCEVYLPEIHFPANTISVSGSSGTFEHDPINQILHWRDMGNGTQYIEVMKWTVKL
ncbi:hypothetical protein SmJEL517_g01095 [Synchytrium microbalum]|uniref:Glycoside hydrolase family 5 domain-containing protein n=1 Tax=Synchytrium microbalum TaxID=1806994 RepID=A0A507CHL5_9FUNG|nr:uncharacterized protein SmJEL517_g01095 [Synchytrium microbalum]TPX37083.1 hypothetical protein SmJEL517_g01095 [Synchytrium microbalum]